MNVNGLGAAGYPAAGKAKVRQAQDGTQSFDREFMGMASQTWHWRAWKSKTAGFCISVSLTARSWRLRRKKNNAEIWRAVLCRPLLSVKIHLWGTAITG